MNINFHYFAVKTLARCAGFCEEQAQQISKYSQFVDDYNYDPHINCSNIPKDIVNSKEFDLFTPAFHSNFSPTITGFSSPFDYASLIVKREQKFILSPFHFTPFNELNAGKKDRRVVPLQFNDNSLTDRLLNNIINEYHNGEKWNIALMKLGMLLHVFADTHAHQMFTGFDSWANKVLITEVKNNITNKTITGTLSGIREIYTDTYKNIPAIGHAAAGHLPDLTNISFTAAYKLNSGDNYSGSYSRDNTEAFIKTAQYIYSYFKKCRGNLPISDNDYSQDELNTKLRHCFLTEIPKKDIVNNLSKHWNRYFPDIKYHYDSKEIKNQFHLAATEKGSHTNAFTAYTEEFYEYNIMANKLLIALYGPQPRRKEKNLLRS